MSMSGVERSQLSSQKKVAVLLLVRTKEIFLEGVEFFLLSRGRKGCEAYSRSQESSIGRTS